jgi:hypothetical protein
MIIRGRISHNGVADSSFDYGLNPRRDGFNGVSFDGSFEFMSQGGNAQQEFGFKVLRDFRKHVYRFHAERPNVGRCAIGLSTELNPDGSNLAEVLHVLQSKNPPRFASLNELLTKVFPFITGIAVTMEQNHESSAKVFEIQVWLDREREDLVVPLNKCGTGIGQALAILYVLATSTVGRTTIIDEPQSFLHPGAATMLVQIMNEHKEHQYFISTHAPEILAAIKPSTITALDYVEGESRVHSLDTSQSDELRRVFDRLGIDFSIFFSTRVLWVEGPTEEKAFPLIVQTFFGKPFAARLMIRALADTGSLQAKRNAKRMFEIYRTLSGAHALVPPIAAVILDDENRGDRIMTDLQRLGEGLLHFIRRRCYENYLLDGDAVAAIANQQENFAVNSVTAEQVQNMIESAKASKTFLPKHDGGPTELADDEWLRTVDGARLLQYIFSELSERRVTYQKTLHSVEITKWMLANDRGDFKEIADLIREVTQENRS